MHLGGGVVCLSALDADPPGGRLEADPPDADPDFGYGLLYYLVKPGLENEFIIILVYDEFIKIKFTKNSQTWPRIESR